MSKILLIDDDPVITRVYDDFFRGEGFDIRVASDGAAGIEALDQFNPDLVLLDLFLPKVPGPQVLKRIRAHPSLGAIPVIVFSNAYLSSMVQAAWNEGATQCLTKAECTPEWLLRAVRNSLDQSAPELAHPEPGESHTAFLARGATGARVSKLGSHIAFLCDLFAKDAPSILTLCRGKLHSMINASNSNQARPHLQEFREAMHSFSCGAGAAGYSPAAHLAAAMEALLQELHEDPSNLTPSTLRTLAHSLDFLGELTGWGSIAQRGRAVSAVVLVVDDEPVARRVIRFSMELANLGVISVDDPQVALGILSENKFQVICLDVDMPGMNGFELCKRLRTLPAHRKTPVIFLTGLTDFESRSQSILSGGNDFISKPFLPIELAVKVLSCVFRSEMAGGRAAGPRAQ